MTAFFRLGKLVEYGLDEDMFTNSLDQRTRDYTDFTAPVLL